MNNLTELRGELFKILMIVGLSFFLVIGLLVMGIIKSPIIAIAIPVGVIFAGIIILNPVLGVLFLVFFVQLDAILNIIFQAIPVSGVKLVAMLTLLGVLYNSMGLKRSERWGKDDLIFRFAIMFAIALVISFLYVDDMQRGYWSLRRYLSVILLLYLVYRVIDTEEQIEKVILAIVSSTLISSLIMLADWFFGGHLVSSDVAATTAQFGDVSRSSGASDYNPTTSATMMLAGVTLSLFLLMRYPRWRLLTGATVLVGSIGLTLSFARSAALVYAIALIWILIKHYNHRMFLLILFGMLMSFVMAIPFIPEEYWERLYTLIDSSADSSLGRRMTYHIIGLDLFVQNPLLGVGPGNFPAHYIDTDYRWLPGRVLIPRQLHNTYMEVLVETGLLGATCFYLMLGVAVRRLHLTYKYNAGTTIAMYAEALHYAMVSFLLVSVFMPNEYNKYTWILVGIAIVISRKSKGIQFSAKATKQIIPKSVE